MSGGLNLAEVERRLPIPPGQDLSHRQIGRLLENLLQLPLNVLCNAFHGNSFTTLNSPPAYDAPLS